MLNQLNKIGFNVIGMIVLIAGSTYVQAAPSTTVDLPTQTMPHIIDNPKPEDFQQMKKKNDEAKMIEYKPDHENGATRAVQEGSSIILKR